MGGHLGLVPGAEHRRYLGVAGDEAVAQQEGQGVLDGKVERLAVALLQVLLALLVQLLLTQRPPCTAPILVKTSPCLQSGHRA